MARRQGRGSTVARDRAGKAVRTAAVPAQQASMTGASRATRAAAGVPRVARKLRRNDWPRRNLAWKSHLLRLWGKPQGTAAESPVAADVDNHINPRK